jgi:hypothetical protein
MNHNCSNNGDSSISCNSSTNTSNTAWMGGAACVASQASRREKSMVISSPSNYLSLKTHPALVSPRPRISPYYKYSTGRDISNPSSIAESIIVCLLQLSVVVTMLVAFSTTQFHPDSNQLPSEISNQNTRGSGI